MKVKDFKTKEQQLINNMLKNVKGKEIPIKKRNKEYLVELDEDNNECACSKHCKCSEKDKTKQEEFDEKIEKGFELDEKLEGIYKEPVDIDEEVEEKEIGNCYYRIDDIDPKYILYVNVKQNVKESDEIIVDVEFKKEFNVLELYKRFFNECNDHTITYVDEVNTDSYVLGTHFWVSGFTHNKEALGYEYKTITFSTNC